MTGLTSERMHNVKKLLILVAIIAVALPLIVTLLIAVLALGPAR